METKKINVGKLASATEVQNCTNSCTDGDIICCKSHKSLDAFSF